MLQVDAVPAEQLGELMGVGRVDHFILRKSW
jgi:hypothetical protein